MPLVLEAELRPIDGLSLPDGWRDGIAAALPLAGAVGAYRTRGLGRCDMRVGRGSRALPGVPFAIGGTAEWDA